MKHNAKRVCRCLSCGGRAVTFGSMAEADFYFSLLKIKERADGIGRVKDIEVHPRFEICKGVVVEADFAFVELFKDGWHYRVIDVKGPGKPLTASFKKNQKLVRERLGIEIEVVRHRARRR